MINTALIGFGKWGKIIKKKIEKVSNLRAIYRSKDNFSDKLSDIDWVIVATPNHTHYEIVKKCLEKKINVFCEKPLATDYNKCLELFNLAKKNNKKLYVDDIENFKNLKIKFSKNNTIVRKKDGGGRVEELLFRLAYHDFYLIYDYVFKKKITNFKILDNKKNLNFVIYFDNEEFNFLYDVNSPEKCHYINQTNFLLDNDVIETMFKKVFKKEISFERNKNASLFAIYIIDFLKKNISFD